MIDKRTLNRQTVIYIMISVIVCSTDPAKFSTVKGMYAAALGNEPWELIGIHDAPSLAEGFSRGISQSRGEWVVLSHDDIEIMNPQFPQRLAGHLATYDIIGVAGTSRLVNGLWVSGGPPYTFGQVAIPWEGKILVNIYGMPRRVMGGIQAMDGLFLAARRDVFSKISFDPVTFDGFHLYDLDFTFNAYCSGLKLAVVGDINILHLSRGQFADSWKHYAERFHKKWAGQLAGLTERPCKWTCVSVQNRAEALEVMNPTYWD
jgi:hypothetical protein